MNKKAEALAATGLETKKQENMQKAKSKKSVYIYIGALFIIVLLLILLSYFIQSNNSELHSLNEKNATAQQNIENLQTMNLQLRADNDAFITKISDLEEQVGELQSQVNDIMQQWRDDVKNIREIDATQYKELLTKYNEIIEKYEVKGD